MPRHINLTIPLACPHCRTEIPATLDDVQEGATIECSACRTAIDLRPENLPMPPQWNSEPPEAHYYGIQI